MTPPERPTVPLASRLQDLDLVGRLLLTTDGTVTPMLEHIVDEPIITARIDQRCAEADDRIRALLEVPAGERLLARSTDLVGARSGAVYVQAQTTAVPHALPPQFQHSLLRTQEPIGVILRRQKVETFREILTYETGGERQSRWASREYRVFIGGVPALLISERFTAPCLRPLPL